MDKHECKARDYFVGGCNCAQAVFAAFCEDMALDERTALKIASSFGGGIAQLREVCGAVTGMFMAAGMLYGFEDNASKEAKDEHYKRLQAMAEKFRADNQSILCRELLQMQQEGREPIPAGRCEEYYQERPCARLVMDAARLLAQELKQDA